jgi:hypothetical protein
MLPQAKGIACTAVALADTAGVALATMTGTSRIPGNAGTVGTPNMATASEEWRTGAAETVTPDIGPTKKATGGGGAPDLGDDGRQTRPRIGEELTGEWRRACGDTKRMEALATPHGELIGDITFELDPSSGAKCNGIGGVPISPWLIDLDLHRNLNGVHILGGETERKRKLVRELAEDAARSMPGEPGGATTTGATTTAANGGWKLPEPPVAIVVRVADESLRTDGENDRRLSGVDSRMGACMTQAMGAPGQISTSRITPV